MSIDKFKLTPVSGFCMTHIAFNYVRRTPLLNINIINPEDETRNGRYNAKIDTGATCSVITQRIVDAVGPFHHNGDAEGLLDQRREMPRTEPYFIVRFQIAGNNNTRFDDTVDTLIWPDGSIGPDIDVLIGLDILERSEFNYNGITGEWSLIFIQG